MDQEERAHHFFSESLRAAFRSKRRALFMGISTLLLGSIISGLWFWNAPRVNALLRGEASLDGAPRYRPDRVMAPYARGAIDFERVHRVLIPAWTLGLARASAAPVRYWRRRADILHEHLATELEPDPNLTDLVAWTHHALSRDPLGQAERLDYWLWAYNRYLDEADVPWRLEASLRIIEGHRAVLSTRSYAILADSTTQGGERIRLMRRADHLGSVEGFLGKTPRGGEGAMVLMRRVLHFTVRHVWPALDPALDERRPSAERSWLPSIREEVRSALPETTFQQLMEAAGDQQALVEVAAEIDARHACGSEFTIRGLPYRGLSPQSVAVLHRALEDSRGDEECPLVTLDEAARIVGASERLAAEEGLSEALERLTMLVARSVAAHELRHVADGDDADAISCPGCAPAIVGLARAEVSAYLAAMSTEGLGYLALFQACATPSGHGMQGAAREAVLRAVLPLGCEGPPLWGLYTRAAEIEAELFGERERVELPALPERVQLWPRPERSRSSQHIRPPAARWGMSVDVSR